MHLSCSHLLHMSLALLTVPALSLGVACPVIAIVNSVDVARHDRWGEVGSERDGERLESKCRWSLRLNNERVGTQSEKASVDLSLRAAFHLACRDKVTDQE